MLTFRKRTFRESVLRLWPAYRERQDARTKEAIRALLLDPDMPCVVGGRLIPNGHGSAAQDVAAKLG